MYQISRSFQVLQYILIRYQNSRLFFGYMKFFLFFGKNMSHSLINPNQLRIFEVVIQDNLYHATESMYIIETTASGESLLLSLQ